MAGTDAVAWGWKERDAGAAGLKDALERSAELNAKLVDAQVHAQRVLVCWCAMLGADGLLWDRQGDARQKAAALENLVSAACLRGAFAV
eukprot:2591107-Rhodomonas_salina.1